MDIEETKKVMKTKRTRCPSVYNLFVKDAILALKDSNLLPKQKLARASELWRAHKEKPVVEEVDVRPAKLDPEVEEPVVVVRKKKTSSRKNKVVCCPNA